MIHLTKLSISVYDNLICLLEQTFYTYHLRYMIFVMLCGQNASEVILVLVKIGYIIFMTIFNHSLQLFM